MAVGYFFPLILIFAVLISAQDLENVNQNSCSYQIPGGKPNSCIITFTEGCPSLDEWGRLPFAGRDFPIDVTIYPYVKTVNVDYSAWNTTFTVLSPDVTGIIFRYQWNCAEYRQCRIYNFAEHGPLQLPVKFWYDDIWAQTKEVGNCLAVEVAALPHYNQKKKFIFKIPSVESIGKGHPLPVIDLSSGLATSSLKTYFTCPVTRTVETNKSTLYSYLEDHTSNRSRDSVTIGSCNNDSPPSIMWENLLAGVNYSVVVTRGQHCENDTSDCVKKYSPKFILNSGGDGRITNMTVIFIAVSCALVMTVAIILLYKRPPPRFSASGKKPQVVLLYSHDTKLHAQAVEALAKYLATRCGLVVLLDKWDLQCQNPYNWLNKSMSSADFVCIVWSRGAALKASRPDVCLSDEPDYLGGDLFTPGLGIAKMQICEEMRNFGVLRRPRFCHLRLPYVPRTLVTCDLRYLQVFKVPKQLHNLVKFLSSSSTSCGFCLGFEDLSQNDLKVSNEGREFLAAVAAMQRFEEQDPQWLQKLVVEKKLERAEVTCGDCGVDLEVEVSTENESESNDDDNSDDGKEREYGSWTEEFPPRLDQLPLFSVLGENIDKKANSDFGSNPNAVLT